MPTRGTRVAAPASTRDGLPAVAGAVAVRTAALLAVALGVLALLLAGPPAAAGEAGGEGVRGTLIFEGERLEGVTIIVEQDGDEVASAETDENGQFLVELDEPGEYTVILDVDTLPDDVAPRDTDTREVTVRPGSVSPAAFPLGDGDRTTATTAAQAAQLFVGGLRFGLVIAMAAIGLSLIFGTTGLTNFSHGELVTGGALLAYFFNVIVGLNLIPAAMLAVGVGGILGGLLDRGLWRPLRRRGTGLIAALVVSIGLSLFLRYGYLYIFGGSARSYAQYATPAGVQFGPVLIPIRDLVIIVLSIVVLTAVGLALQRTKLGKATRAVADNPALASASGIDVERVINVVWIVGTALAVLGGVLLALSQQVQFLLGFQILLLLFAGVTLGGIGTAFGAFVGSVIIGIFTQMSTLIIPAELQNVGALIILILILIVRPQGILGRRERVG